MNKPKHHILVCCSFRASGEPQGICHRKGSTDFLGYLENELLDRGMDNVQVSSTGCLKVCDRGPAMVIQPENLWYGKVETTNDLDAILDALEEGRIANDYLIV